MPDHMIDPYSHSADVFEESAERGIISVFDTLLKLINTGTMQTQPHPGICNAKFLFEIWLVHEKLTKLKIVAVALLNVYLTNLRKLIPKGLIKISSK